MFPPPALLHAPVPDLGFGSRDVGLPKAWELKFPA